MKRQLPNLDSTVQTKKLKLGEFTVDKHTEFLSLLTSLSDSISEISRNSNTDKPIIDELNNCRNKIPTIVTFGAQSSGKSALLNRLFPGLNLNLKSCNGIGTRCPIEIQAGPSHKGEIIVRSLVNQNEITVKSLEEAEEIASNNTDESSIQVHGKIIYKINYPQNITIIDLPGVQNKSDDHRAYFEYIKQTYLMKPETIILHVVHCTADPDIDISREFLPSNSKIIKVLTHTDHWTSDPSTLSNWYKLDKTANFSFAVTNKCDNECDLLNKLEIEPFNNELLIGSAELLSVITREHQSKIREFIPEFSRCITKAKQLIESKFEVIGMQKPDMRYTAGEFRSFMSKVIEKDFSDGSNLAFEINQLNGQFSVRDMRSFETLIPSREVLATELQSGTLDKIAGSEGFDPLLKKWISVLISNVKDRMVILYAQRYCEILIKQAVYSLRKEYKSCTVSASDKIIGKLEEKYGELIKSIFAKLCEKLDCIAAQPYNSDENYVRQIEVNSHVEITKKCFEWIKQQQNLTQALDYAIASPEKIIEFVMPNGLNNIYLTQATNAHEHLTSFWKSKTVYIHDWVVEELNNYRKTFKTFIEREIQDIYEDDLNEPVEIESQRKVLTGIYNQIEDINKLLF